ncbi:MAG TPA: phosphoribosylamine--glycine ligase [Acidimicrobiales bacterium]|nr:phosphoribosylamine--glycine ligase [Acidimicrobiales bacterium]
MRVCVVGSGGREHALAASLARTEEVVVVPGNAGMEGLTCVDVPPERVEADLFVIGPEAPLVDGLADRLRGRGAAVFGPGADGARLEGSKAWMKEVLVSARVPTPPSRVFSELEPALAYLRSSSGPWAVKTDGLAAGKGVLVTAELGEALHDVRAKMSGKAFGDAGRKVVIEDALEGEEASLIAICDGRRAYPLAAAQDFKRAGDGGTGANTGGMGAYSPVAFCDDELVGQVMERAVLPTLHALRRRGVDYRGALYAGLMVGDEGINVLEFNVRFGDPEAQALLPLWEGDVAATLNAAASGALSDHNAPAFSKGAAVCVVLASPGYPEHPRPGDRIEGLEDARSVPGALVYAAGVRAAPDAGLVTAGGRALGIVGTGHDVAAARRLAYEAAGMVSWPGMVYRSDIAKAAADREGS